MKWIRLLDYEWFLDSFSWPCISEPHVTQGGTVICTLESGGCCPENYILDVTTTHVSKLNYIKLRSFIALSLFPHGE